MPYRHPWLGSRPEFPAHPCRHFTKHHTKTPISPEMSHIMGVGPMPIQLSPCLHSPHPSLDSRRFVVVAINAHNVSHHLDHHRHLRRVQRFCKFCHSLIAVDNNPILINTSHYGYWPHTLKAAIHVCYGYVFLFWLNNRCARYLRTYGVSSVLPTLRTG